MQSDMFNAEGFDRGYKQALADLLKMYADLDEYDEIFACKLRRDIKTLQKESE